MIANSDRDDLFEKYFHDRASIADQLSEQGWDLESRVLSTAALDSLGAIWASDFPDAPEPATRGSLRMARLVKTFASSDLHAGKVAVVSFAEDWKRYTSNAAADRLLRPRLGTFRGELPHAHLDVRLPELVAECPEIASDPKLVALAEEYEYAAIVYRFYRCPMVHESTGAKRTHGFTKPDEIFYMPLGASVSSIGFGAKVFTEWLRAVASGYVDACAAAGVKPAGSVVDSGARGEDDLQRYWSKLGKE